MQIQKNRGSAVTWVHLLTQQLWYTVFSISKASPRHLSQLGAGELYPSTLFVRPGWGCHLHVTSVYYPNVPVLCMQMEAFILLLLGLHPSDSHLTGIPMFPTNAVSDSVFSALIWRALRALVLLQTRLLQSSAWVAQQREREREVFVDCLTPAWSANSHDLGCYSQKGSARCWLVVQKKQSKETLFNSWVS